MLTVRDILQLPILSSGKVVAGARGLSRVVEHVSVMEVDLTKCAPLPSSVAQRWKFLPCTPWPTARNGRYRPSSI